MPNSQPTVVIIDDEPEILVALQRTLLRSPLRVLTTNDPVEGVAMVLRERPQSVIVDLQMPTLTGLDVARRLHHELEGEMPQLILLSGSALTLPAEDRCLFDVVMQKPWSPQALRDLMPQPNRIGPTLNALFGHDTAHHGDPRAQGSTPLGKAAP